MPEVSLDAVKELDETVASFGLDATELLSRPDPGYGLKPDHTTRLTREEVKTLYPWLPDSCVDEVVAGHVIFDTGSKLPPVCVHIFPCGIKHSQVFISQSAAIMQAFWVRKNFPQ